MTHKRKQADSLFLDYPFDAWNTIDATWSNWSAVWTICAAAGSPVILSGSLQRSDTEGEFNLRIGPLTIFGWATLPVGTYVLTAEINNAAADYRYEEQSKLVIVEQGVPNV